MSQKIVQILFILTLTSAFVSVNAGYQGSVCKNASSSRTMNRGDTYTLCVFFPALSQKVAFDVVVDKYTALDLKGAFSKLVQTFQSFSPTSLMYLQTEANLESGFVTYLKYTQSTSVIQTMSVFSIVINIRDGVVTEFTWDNGCWNGSGSDVCYSDTSLQNYKNNYVTTCTASSNNSSCDPKVYVSWIGTDANGNSMTSSGFRLSRFQSYSISDLYSSSKSIFS